MQYLNILKENENLILVQCKRCGNIEWINREIYNSYKRKLFTNSKHQTYIYTLVLIIH